VNTKNLVAKALRLSALPVVMLACVGEGEVPSTLGPSAFLQTSSDYPVSANLEEFNSLTTGELKRLEQETLAKLLAHTPAGEERNQLAKIMRPGSGLHVVSMPDPLAAELVSDVLSIREVLDRRSVQAARQ
jgi:hypothetical protein